MPAAPTPTFSPTPPLTTAPTPSTLSGPSTPLSSDSSSSTSTPICTHQHAMYCFDVLAAHFEGREPGPPPFENGDDSYALFVTWNTISPSRANKKPTLRGCIGNFTPMPLGKGLKEYALISALEDHRFSPITKAELPNLQVGISLLTPFTPITTPLDWIPGVHGIHITFPPPSSSSSSSSATASAPAVPKRPLSATYLPEVCLDQGWTKEQAVLSAISKAGYRGRVQVGDKVWESLQVKRYASVKAEGRWGDYVGWRK